MTKRILLLSAAFLLAVSANAKTVGWWRFEEAAAKAPITENSVFKNEIDAAKFPAYAGVCAYGKNGKYSKDTIVFTPEKMPLATNAFPSTISLLNWQDAKCELANNGAVALNMHTINSANSPHAQIFIDDDEELRLQTFTLEFFARMPDTTAGYRCLVTRCGGVYSDARTAFRLHGQLFNSGNMYFLSTFSTVEDPLYDDNGIITNQVINSVKASFDASKGDNDRWHHFAIAVDGTAKTYKVYIDHVLRGSATYTGDIYYEMGYPLAFGGHPQCTYFNSAMLVDEIRLSNVALKPTEMLKYSRASVCRDTETVDEDTLLYFPFDGGEESITVGADDMHEPVAYVPYLANQAVNVNFAGMSADKIDSPDETDGYEIVSAVPGSLMRMGLRGGNARQNSSSMHYMTNTAIVVDNGTMQEDLFSESCTVEFFFKAPNSGFFAFKGNGHLLGLYSAFQIQAQEGKGNWKDKYLWATVGTVNLRTKSGTEGITGCFNDKWHHLAIVYDKESSKADFYLDYTWRMGAVDLPSNLGLSRNKYYQKGLVIGGSYWDFEGYTHKVGVFSFDEVRVSRGALRPYQFLTSKAVEEDLLAHASFEDNLVMTPYTNFFGATGTASAFVAGAAKPKCVRTRPARVLTAGQKGDVVTDANRYSLEFNGGKVVYPSRALLADTDEFTLEFFLKTDDARPGAGIMRVNRETSSAISNAVTWALSFADTDGNLQLKLDTDAEEGQTQEFAAALADDKWHHVGVQFARSGGNAEVKVYRDAELVGSWSANGRMLTRPRSLNFMLGAGEDPSAGFVGLVDELRITPGIVPHTEFLTPRRKTTTLIIR